MPRRAILMLQALQVLAGCSPALQQSDEPTTVAPDPGDGAAPARPGAALALVYRGPGACEGCAESLAVLLQGAGLTTRYVGPADLRRDATFAGAELYAQPGGDASTLVRDAVGASAWPAAAQRLRDFVAGGGRYLGVCLGGFLAGEWLDDEATTKALDLLDGDVGYFTGTAVDPAADQVVPITWVKPLARRQVYFQEGPYFDARGTVYGRYADGKTAALVATYRGGKVGVLGVHLEAEADWYTANDLSDPDGVDWDLGRQFVHDLLE